MVRNAYLFDRLNADRYVFTSVGKNRIRKAVDFTPTSIKNLYTLSFGDLLPDGSIDDRVKSNNGDILTVLATVVQIARNFTAQHPDIQLIFTGSTEERTKMYGRILKMYYKDFCKDFRISAFIERDEAFEEVNFDPAANVEYLAFFVKRID